MMLFRPTDRCCPNKDALVFVNSIRGDSNDSESANCVGYLSIPAKSSAESPLPVADILEERHSKQEQRITNQARRTAHCRYSHLPGHTAADNCFVPPST